ncbi:MAG: DUF2341 domain-containing protein [Chitinispirillaceae bacterium]|nr:DUF2341 domain-containing protein [Chitinispirillaceae bacterium]
MRAIIVDRILLPAAACAALCALHCADLSGGGSEAGNARVIGRVMNAQGSPAGNVMVRVIPSDYDPVKGTMLLDSVLDTTGTDGRYGFTVQKGLTYTIQAVHMTLRTRALVAGVAVGDTDITAPPCTLNAPGAIKVMLPDGADKTLGYIYLPGTSVLTFLNNAAGFVVLDSVPAGVIPSVSYSSTNGTAAATIRYDVPVPSGDTVTVWNPSWKYARELLLNTTQAGAGVAGTVAGFPVLVRLTSAHFSFPEAKADGADIRFTKPDNTFLSYEIERWDSSGNAAEVWVNVDTILGNNSSQYVVMYWGNPDAASGSNGAAVFNTANGFQGVWHLSEAGNTTAFDATANGYNGTPHNMTAASSVAGAIGNARAFNGSSQYITMSNTASSNLNFPEDGSYSMSVWVYADTLDTLWRAIAGKGHEQYYLQLKGLGNNRATWEFVEFHNQSGWEYTEDSVPPAPGSGTWLHLTGVRSGSGQRLYINGTLTVNAPSLMAGSYSRVTSDNFTIGRYARSVTIPYYQGLSYFNGRIDEVRVSSRVPGADWIKLCYMNQKADDALVEFR